MKFIKSDALTIANKLGAQASQRRRHEQWLVKHNGRTVARISVRRASQEVGHDFIPENLHITRPQTRKLIECSLNKESYFSLLAQAGWT